MVVNLILKRKFKWPCHKRKAHGPHLSHCMNHPSGQPESEPFERCPNCVECPGVKAHPATQIGGAYDEW